MSVYVPLACICGALVVLAFYHIYLVYACNLFLLIYTCSLVLSACAFINVHSSYECHWLNTGLQGSLGLVHALIIVWR